MYAVIIATVLALTSFSIKPNPRAPTAAAVLEHAVDDADLVVHLDVAATVGANYGVLASLSEDALVKQVPELRQQLTQAVMQLESGRTMARAMLGFDPVTDLTSVTAFVRMREGMPQPEFLLVVRGTLPADLPAKLASSLGGRTGSVDGRTTVTLPDGTVMGTSRSGALLVGKAEWVNARVASAWRAPAHAKGSPWARIATALDARPFFLIASKAAPALVATLAKGLGDNFGRDLVANHKLGVLAVAATGVTWMYEASDAAFARRMESASLGLLELMRAAHLAPRGMAQVAVAALPSYARVSKDLDAVIGARDKLLAAVWDLTGDGKFTARVRVDGTLVTATATGKKLSDVLPISFVGGLAAIGFLTAADAPTPVPPASKPPAVRPAPRPAPAPPRKGTSLGAPVKTR